jgi:caffeoyl-CoA O-methyltransferase
MKKNAKSTFLLGLVMMVLFGCLLSDAMAQPGRGNRGGGANAGGDAQLEKPPVPENEYEKKVLAILDDIRARQSYRNVPPNDGRLLRLLTETMNAKNVIEVGTSTGYSGIWFGLALKKTGGKLTTYEIDEGRAATAQANFNRAGMSDIITLVLGDAHEEVKKLKDPIDLLFLDADKEGYVDYLDKLLPLIRPGGLIIGHNINPRMADPNFMKAINSNPKLDTMVRSGVSLTLKKK